MTTSYDYIIIGGGPVGLTLAWLLGKAEKKCCLIENEPVLGGCHRVNRIGDDQGLFSEHGPRIYSSSFLTFRSLLTEMGYDFFDLFTPYNFQLFDIKYRFNIRELLILTKAFIYLIFNENYGKTTTLLSFMTENTFRKEAIHYADRMCRISDGAGADKYTLFQFLAAANQQIFYKIYQPVAANDKGLIDLWTKEIQKYNVDILTSINIVNFGKIDNRITSITLSNNKILTGKNIILAIPSKQLYNYFLTPLNNLPPLLPPNTYNIDKKWVEYNSYNDYLTFDYHWFIPINLPKVQGINPDDAWAIIFIKVSDYFAMEKEAPSKVIITASIGYPDGLVDGKTAHQYTTTQELIDKVFEQMKIVLGNIPMYDKAVATPGVYYENGKWKSRDTGYIRTVQESFIEPKSPIFENVYWVGTHNGNSKYYFTSIESAVGNAVHFANTQVKTNLVPLHPIEATGIIRYALLVLVFLIIIFVIKRRVNAVNKR